MHFFDKIAKIFLSEHDFEVRMAHKEIELDLKEIMRNDEAPLDGKEHFIIKGQNTKRWRAYFLDEGTPVVIYRFTEKANSNIIVEKLFALKWKSKVYYGFPFARNTKTIYNVIDYVKKYETVLEWVKENVKDGQIVKK